MLTRRVALTGRSAEGIPASKFVRVVVANPFPMGCETEVLVLGGCWSEVSFRVFSRRLQHRAAHNMAAGFPQSKPAESEERGGHRFL